MTIGNLICEVTELSREDETITGLKHNVVSWFSPNASIFIVIFPILATCCNADRFMTLSHKYNTYSKKNTLVVIELSLECHSV